MRATAPTYLVADDDASTSALLAQEHADAERLLNGVRAVVLLLLSGTAALYAGHVSRGLSLVNALVLAPMILWTAAQHLLFARQRIYRPWLSTVNAALDASAVTLLLIGYAAAGFDDLALKAPVWVTYFLILAARPFTTSARHAATTASIVVVEYAALVVYVIGAGHVALSQTPLASATGAGTYPLDEVAKVLLLAAAGCISTYATAWNERTLLRAATRLQAREDELRALIAAMSDLIIVLDREGRYLRIAPSGAGLLHRPAEELLGRRLHDVFPAAQADTFLRTIHQALDRARPVELEYELPTADGTMRWFFATVTCLSADTALWVARDVTARRSMEQALRESESRHRTLFDASPRPMWVYDVETLRFLAVNEAAVRQYGYSREEYLGMTLRDIRPNEDVARLEEDVREMPSGYNPSGIWRHRHRDGTLRTVDITSHSITFSGRRARVVVVTDITEQLRAAEAVRQSEARFRAIFDHAAVGIAILDAQGTIVETNAAFQRVLGYTADELRGRPSGERSPAEDAELTRALVQEILSGARESGTIEKRYVRKDGGVIWATLTVSRAGSDRDCRLIGMVQDVTDRKALEAQLTHQAFHDPLTGLANRTLFRDRVQHAVARGQRQHERIAVLFLDLDNFKTVNDSLGHAEGDRLLSAVAGRLVGATRDCDTVARLGGDEFAVLLEELREERDAIQVAERVTAALRAPIALGGRSVAIGASIGIARAADGDGADELLRNADVAMYMAKSNGKARWEVFAPPMHAALVDRLALEADLRRATERGELLLHYQPIIELATGRIAGVEALARWAHADRGLVPPMLFIPIAEEMGLIGAVGRWALNEACAQVAHWRRTLGGSRSSELSISINVSGRQLRDETFAADVADALRVSQLDPAALVLEVTESVVMQDAEAALERLVQLKALGVRLAIDDFGTGYSSLSYLQRLPVDVLKIDKAFVDGLARDGGEAAFARTIVALGELLELDTIAEGIETELQRSALTELGCAYGQGYLFAHPLSADECATLLGSAVEPGMPQAVAAPPRRASRVRSTRP